MTKSTTKSVTGSKHTTKTITKAGKTDKRTTYGTGGTANQPKIKPPKK